MQVFMVFIMFERKSDIKNLISKKSVGKMIMMA